MDTTLTTAFSTILTAIVGVIVGVMVIVWYCSRILLLLTSDGWGVLMRTQ